ncbi:wax ester/triacylglycerol synthase family O-acyltransferase [bacterium]|nr:wax ester/triacylglycerol synthase family O-acyltransferase [bacterium]
MAQRLGPMDAIWLLIERANQPMHVGGLQLFDLPEGAPRNWLRKQVEAFDAVTEPQDSFGKIPVLKRGMYQWATDDNFDLEHHFRHSALPKPGRPREVLELVSRLHSHRMDRNRPLWESHVIEGLSGKRFAIYNKIHHAMMDGVAASRFMQKIMSEDPERMDMPPPWGVSRRSGGSRSPNEPTPMDAFAAAFEQVKEQVTSVSAVSKAVLGAWKGARSDETEVGPFSAPKSPLNVKVTGSRRFAAQSYSLARMKAVAKAGGATLNDVVLCMCAGALRSYLGELGKLPDDPLISMIPVSVRPEGDENLGNQIGMILANLATDEADVVERLDKIRRSTSHAKKRLESMSPAGIVNYTSVLTAPMLMPVLTGRGAERQVFNVVISNVPGPKNPLYLNGARMASNYPVSIVLDGQALNITVVSYGDSMDFGLTACRRALPHVQRMLGYLEHELGLLEKRLDA